MSYKITNIEYGVGPWDTNFLYGMVGNPKPGETEDNVHSVTVLQGEGHTILVDTGVDTNDPVKDQLWSELITECKGVVWALDQVGLTPQDVDTVILTHAHLDHIGGIELFKQARIYIQQKEFEAWERMVSDPLYAQATLPAAMPTDYPPMRQMIEDGVVTLLNGDVINFMPGIDLHVVYDCHSVAEQVVVVHNGEGSVGEERAVRVANEQGDLVEAARVSQMKRDYVTYIIGGDIATRPANLTGMGEWHAYLAPILGRTGSALNVYEAYGWILDQIHGDMTRLVLTHDSTMKDRFESVETEGGLHVNYVVK